MLKLVSSQEPHSQQRLDTARRTLETEIAGLQELASSLDSELALEFPRAVEVIRAAEGRVIVSGIGKSGHIGRKIAATLASTGTRALFMHAAEASHGDLGMVSSEDVVLALSWSGETAELKDLVTYCARYKITLVAITSNRDSALGRAADVKLILPRAQEACPLGLAPTTSTVMQLALGDALAVALLEDRKFTPENFRLYHPGGKLGAALVSVDEVMREAASVETVSPDDDMATALIKMSANGNGCVVVLDADQAIAGIITDGDLRRKMCPELPGLKVAHVMTPSPLVVAPDMLAASALAAMSENKVSALIVSPDSRSFQGIVTMHLMLAKAVA